MAAAEATALEGLMSSPSTQQCAALFHAVVEADVDAHLIDADSQPRNINTLCCASPKRSEVYLLQSVGDPDGLSELTQQVSPTRIAAATCNARVQALPLRKLSFLDNELAHLGQPPYQALPDHRDVTSLCNSRSADIWRPPINGGLRWFHPDGSVASSRVKHGAMEDFASPLYGSGGSSNLSMTQENDPSVYARLLENTANTRIKATQDLNVNGDPAESTGVSQGNVDTGHLTIDYHPTHAISEQAFIQHEEVDELLNQKDSTNLPIQNAFHPHTPAHPKLVMQRPGTVMRLSQVFAETQPSPGSLGKRVIQPSSSRPSPDMLNHQQSPKQASSSPLIQRRWKAMPTTTVLFDNSSSPFHSDLDAAAHPNIGAREMLAKGPHTSPSARGDIFMTAPSKFEGLHEPLDEYTSRKESQERRRQLAGPSDDDCDSSDDGFSDGQAQLSRRAKLKRKQAARELASVGTPRPTSSENDIVEVPSTSTGRRRSLAEEYEAQCLGFDARDTQQHDTVADSQSAPNEAATAVIGTGAERLSQEQLLSTTLTASVHSQFSEEGSVLPANAIEYKNSEQLPGLDENEDSDTTESDFATAVLPTKRMAAKPLGEVSSNIADLRTPATHKMVLCQDGDALIPETSPSEPHLKRYGDIVSQASPLASAEDIDGPCNPFSQDVEFNTLLRSPTPGLRMIPGITNRATEAGGIILGVGYRTPKVINAVQSCRSSPELSSKDEQSLAKYSINTAPTCCDEATEYITAPTSLPYNGLRYSKTKQGILQGDSPTLSEAMEPMKDETTKYHFENDSHNTINLKMPPEILGRKDLNFSMAEKQKGPQLRLKGLPQEVGTIADKGDNDDIVSATHKRHSQVKCTRSLPRKVVETSSYPLKGITKQKMGPTDNLVSSMVAQLAPEQSDVMSNRLRSASQLRGSSRALRRLVDDSHAGAAALASDHVTSISTARKAIRSSRRASITSIGTAMSNELADQVSPMVSTRRRPPQTIHAESGLFSNMAFSVSYITREDEKQNVLRLIKQNGGRILELGFDELFDMTAIRLTTSASNISQSGENSGGNSLTLTMEARSIGFACLLADVHSRKVKYMQALALGLPCISGRWVEHCVTKGMVLDWDTYLLAAGDSSFLGGAVRNRNLQPYSAITAKFASSFALRPRLLTGKAILLVLSKARVERKKAYFFLTQLLGPERVKRVHTNQEARKFLLEAENEGREWNWVYVDDDEEDAEKVIFGQTFVPAKKRKRGSAAHDEAEGQLPAPKKVKIISDEYVIQSLILGKLLEEA